MSSSMQPNVWEKEWKKIITNRKRIKEKNEQCVYKCPRQAYGEGR